MANNTYTARIQFLGLTEADTSTQAISKALRELRAEISKTDPGTAKYRELTNQIGKLQSELNGLRQVQKEVTKAYDAQAKVPGSIAAIKAQTAQLISQYQNLSVGVNVTQDQYQAMQFAIAASNDQIRLLTSEMSKLNTITNEAGTDATNVFDDYEAGALQAAAQTKEFRNNVAALSAENATLTDQLRFQITATGQAASNWRELASAIAANNAQLGVLQKEQKTSQANEEQRIQLIERGNALRDITNRRGAKDLQDAREQQKALVELIGLRQRFEAIGVNTNDKNSNRSYRIYQEQLEEVTLTIKALEFEQKQLGKNPIDTSETEGSLRQLQERLKKLKIDFGNVGETFATKRQNIANQITEVTAKINLLKSELQTAPSFTERLASSFKKSFKEIVFQAGAALGAIEGFRAIKDIGGEFLGIERGFAKVNTVAQLGNTELEALKSTVLDLGRNATADLESLPDALFTIQSATGDVAESQDVLGSSLKAAKAGFNDLQSTAEAGVGIFGAVKNEVKNADEVFDVLFRTQREGLLTFQDLSKEFPKVIPSAQALGAGFREAAAAGATFTKFGFNANNAFSAVDATLKGLAKTTVQANLKQIGVEVFDAAGKTRPLVKIMEDLQGQLIGLTDKERLKKLGDLGLDENAAKGLGSLTQNLEVFKQVSTSIVEGSGGELERQFAASQNTADDLQIAINNLKVTLFTELGPAFTAVAQSATGFLQVLAPVLGFLFRNQIVVYGLIAAYAAYNAIKVKNTITTALETKGTVLNTVATTANAAITRTVTLAKTAYGVASQILAGKITLATVAQRAFNIAASLNPFGVLIAGATALAGVLFLLTDRTVKLTREQKIQKGLSDAVAESYGREQSASAGLFLTLRSETASREEKSKAMRAINEQYGTYLPNLLNEKSSLEDVKKAQDEVNKGLLRKIQLEIQSASVNEELRKQAEALQSGTRRIQELTGLSVAEINRAVDEVSANIKKASREQVVDIGLATDSFSLLASALGKTSGVSQQTRDAIAKINASGASLDFLDLSAAVGQTNREIDIINKYFQDLQPISQFGDSITETSGSFGNLSETVKELNERLNDLREQQAGSRTAAEWNAVQKEIEAVEKRIKSITGTDKDASKSLKKEAKEQKDRAKLIEENEELLKKLREDLAQARLDGIEDDTQRELAVLKAKYEAEIKAAHDAAQKVLEAEVSTDANKVEATKLRDETLLALQQVYETKRITIISESQRKDAEDAQAREQQRTDDRKAILDLQLSTVQGQIELQEKGFEARKKLMQREMELEIRILEAETISNLRSAASDEERTAIMAAQLVEREKIIRNFGKRLEEERAAQGSLLSRITGIDDEELKRIGDVLNQFGKQSLELLQASLDNQLKSIEQQAQSIETRIASIDQQMTEQQTRIGQVEKELEQAQGQRRLRLIRLLEVERQRENALSADREKNTQAQIVLDNKKAEIERKQVAIRKAQAIAQAVANTAVGITRVIAEVPKADFGISTGILIGLYTALGAAQVATIAAQEFADGGKLHGPRHSDPEGGIPVKVRGRRPVLAEGGEFFVNRRSTSVNEDVLQTINADRGRTKFIAVPVGNYPMGSSSTGMRSGSIQMFAGGGKLADSQGIANTVRASAASLSSDAKIDQLINAVKSIPPSVLVATDVTQRQRMQEKARRRVSVN
jgi:TP901 family phage tail tape measure protein